MLKFLVIGIGILFVTGAHADAQAVRLSRGLVITRVGAETERITVLERINLCGSV